ncbi:hypothetical protein [Nitrosomonas communis]|uniref:hypothetical protein n=1 Tax=Nitrosomonas communis TaxID=44574 RepID=UPI003D267DEB
MLGSASKITANARQDSGGHINIGILKDGTFLKTPDSMVNTSSQSGLSGSVTINAPESNIIGSVLILPASFLDVSSLLSEHCAAHTIGENCTFVTTGHGGMPLSPDAPLPAFYLPAEAKTHQENSQMQKRIYA